MRGSRHAPPHYPQNEGDKKIGKKSAGGGSDNFDFGGGVNISRQWGQFIIG